VAPWRRMPVIVSWKSSCMVLVIGEWVVNGCLRTVLARA
jgi:hypothetical protein